MTIEPEEDAVLLEKDKIITRIEDICRIAAVHNVSSAPDSTKGALRSEAQTESIKVSMDSVCGRGDIAIDLGRDKINARIALDKIFAEFGAQHRDYQSVHGGYNNIIFFRITGDTEEYNAKLDRAEAAAKVLGVGTLMRMLENRLDLSQEADKALLTEALAKIGIQATVGEATTKVQSGRRTNLPARG